MKISKNLADSGFSVENVISNDLQDYIDIKRSCYQKYVDQYYGGWIEEVQIKMNNDIFEKTRRQVCFQKIIMMGETVGFWGFNEFDDRIDNITIQMVEKARNQGVGSFFLEQILSISKEGKKPVFLKVFRTNPAQNLYKSFGFVIFEDTPSHFLMRYDP